MLHVFHLNTFLSRFSSLFGDGKVFPEGVVKVKFLSLPLTMAPGRLLGGNLSRQNASGRPEKIRSTPRR